MLSWCQICWFPRYQFGPRADQDQLFQLFLLQSDFLWVYAAPVVSVWKKLHFLAIWYQRLARIPEPSRNRIWFWFWSRIWFCL